MRKVGVAPGYSTQGVGPCLARVLDIRNLSAGTPIRDMLEATAVLVAAGFRAPVWADLPQHAPAQPADDALRGWQRPVIMSQLVPGPAGGPLERAAARVCREAGAAVATNVLVRELNLEAARQDERHIQERTNPEFGRASQCRLVVLGIEVLHCQLALWPISDAANVDGEPPLNSDVLAADTTSAALLDSQAGPQAALVFATRPTLPEFSLESPLFRAILLRRLRLPLPLASATYRCRSYLDPCGDHLAACQDDRHIEVIATGLPLWGGAQLAVDTMLVSPLTAAGLPRRAGGRAAGAALLTARRAERTYPELCRSNRCRLTVLALEIGGRWSAEAATFVRLLARCRARSAPLPSRAAAISAYTLRWSALLSFAVVRSFAASLLSLLSLCSVGRVPNSSLGVSKWRITVLAVVHSFNGISCADDAIKACWKSLSGRSRQRGGQILWYATLLAGVAALNAIILVRVTRHDVYIAAVAAGFLGVASAVLAYEVHWATWAFSVELHEGCGSSRAPADARQAFVETGLQDVEQAGSFPPVIVMMVAVVIGVSAHQLLFLTLFFYLEGSFLVCFCPAYDSSDDSDVSKCNSNSEYCQDAGLLRVSGAESADIFHCVKGAFCTFNITGDMLQSGDHVQPIAFGGRCGSASAVSDFGILRPQAAGTVDTWSDEQAFSFGIANSGGRYEICYCANYDTSERTNSYDAASGAYTACDSDAEFTHSAGALIVHGATGGEAFECVKNTHCSFTLSGFGLHGDDEVAGSSATVVGGLWPVTIIRAGFDLQHACADRDFSHEAATLTVPGAAGGETYRCHRGSPCEDRVRVISYGAVCGSAAAVADFPSTAGSGSDVARTFSLGFAFTTPMLFTVCYCASYDGPDEDLLSCSSDSDFTHEAGSLEVRGAFGAQSYACVKDVNCSVDALGFSLDGDSHVQMVRSSGLCGFSVVVTEFGASRVAATSGNSSYRSFDLAEATEAGRYVVCYCADYSAAAGAHADAATFCTQDAEFSHAAGTVVVRGPMGGEDQVCTAGVPCVLGTFHGQGLAVGNRIAFVLRQIYGSAGLVEVAMDSRGNCQTQGRDDEQGNGASYTGATLDSRSLAAYTMAQGQPPGCSVVETWAGYWMYVNVTAGMVVLLSKWSICYCADYDSTAVSTRITGESLSSLDRVIFVENGVSGDCGVSEFDYRIARDGPKTVGGQWLMCYCAAYEGLGNGSDRAIVLPRYRNLKGCLLPQHFTSLAGMLTVAQPNSQFNGPAI
ncbi:unnamed protein product [Symbiodinium sp. KB8]|nr:unnamed protein product [Symbiodinium sp. KB8]